ncbi:MAG: hydrogenase expression/formation protein HypE, partial [Thermoplasmata archaeon]
MKIEMKHGAGGAAMEDFIKNEIVERIGGGKAEIGLEKLDDSCVVDG